MEIEAGYASEYFVTDAAKAEARLDEPYILIVRGRLTSLRSILVIVEQIADSGRSLLVVADRVEGEALASLVVNKLRGSLRCCALEGFVADPARAPALSDLAALTNARVIAEDELASINLKDLGRADRVVATANRTEIIGGACLN